MAEYTTSQIRNLALVGHAGSGKTLLSESVLVAADALDQAGSIERGSLVSDFDPLEKKHQHSLASSVMSFDRGALRCNLVDTPGYPDFMGAALSVLPAVETVAVVVNALKGIEPTTRKMMDWLAARDQCRMIIVNQIDQPGVDLEAVYVSLQEEFGAECLALNLPADNATRVVDCFFNPDGAADFSSVEQAHTAIVDQAVEVDEELMAEYLEAGKVAADRLHDTFEQALREGHLIPVCFTSAESGVGVSELVTVIERLLPNPTEGNPPRFDNGESVDAEPVEVIADSDRHALGHVFKISFDPFIGRIAYIRMHQGVINRDAQLFIGDARKPIKITSILRPFGHDLKDMNQAIPGDIAVITKNDSLEYDGVLHDSHDEDHIHLHPLELPVPMVGLAITPAKHGDEQKLMDALAKLVGEDPCLKLERNPDVNEVILRGLGDLHLRIAIERLSEQYNVEIETAAPSVPYRETIAREAEGHCRHKKQTGGAGQFGEVFLKVRPLSRGNGFEFVNKVVGGAIPAPLIVAVEKGVRQVLEGGAIAGFPLQDIEVTVYDGKHHPVDSKEIAFVSAGRKAFLDAISKARPMVLEPIMDISVTVPGQSMGDVTGDLSSRRGRVNSTDSVGGDQMIIIGQVPMAEIGDYPSRLNSMTAGEGSFELALSTYEPAPGEVQKRLTEAFEHPEEE
ncbi:MAG: elongation factor G [marine bacterium B5-7]|nr:MAG: elongation factor G [marine bacterium B5-7]